MSGKCYIWGKTEGKVKEIEKVLIILKGLMDSLEEPSFPDFSSRACLSS